MKREAGFTLVELMMTLTVISILLAIGIPSFRYVTNANRASAEVNGLLGDLMYARSEAVRQGTQVAVCTSNDSKTCSGSTSWEAGWIVCVPSVPNAAPPCDITATLLRAQAALTGGDTLRPDASAANSIVFNRVGFASGLPAGARLTLHDKTANATWTRCLSISLVGKLSVATTLTTPALNPPCL